MCVTTYTLVLLRVHIRSAVLKSSKKHFLLLQSCEINGATHVYRN